MSGVVEIQLTKGRVALVSEVDAEDVARWKWNFHNAGYAIGCRYDGVYEIRVLMHRLIMQPGAGQVVDHVNHNRLDNRRCNLRVGTQADNMANRRHILRKGYTSRFRGVARQSKPYKLKKPWLVALCGKYVGTAATEEEGAKLYDLAALRKYGARAQLNFPIKGLEVLA